MNVHAADHKQPWIHAKSSLAEKRPSAAPESVNTAPAAVESEGEKGVLRLLQEGHFRGVADVRLRINFHAELTRANSLNAATQLADNVQPLLDELAGKVGILGEEHGLAAQAGDLADAFANEVGQLLENAKTGQQSIESALGGMGDAFSSFLVSLRSAFAEESAGAEEASGAANETSGETVEEHLPAADDASTDQAAASTADGTAEAEDESGESGGLPDSFESALNELGAWFTESLASLKETAVAGQELPPLSAPQGRGKAYSKFLEIYRDMGAATQDAQPETPPSADDLSVEA